MVLTLQSILCPVDFSEPSRDALRWALALANQWNSRLTVVTAVDPLLADAARLRFDLDLANADVAPALQQFAESVVGAAGMSAVDTRVQVGEPTSVILDAAVRAQADLIVMGTQGLSGVRKWLLGSTVERVLRKTHLPVLAVPAASYLSEQGRPAPGRVSTIVAATDFSEAAGRAVRYAAMLAGRLGARLVLAHVVSPLKVPPDFLRYVEGMEEDSLQQAQALLESDRRAVQVDTADIVADLGSPAERITAIAGDHQAGLIVLGLASDDSKHAARPGAIAYRVLSASHVPVLVVPKDDRPQSLV